MVHGWGSRCSPQPMRTRHIASRPKTHEDQSSSNQAQRPSAESTRHPRSDRARIGEPNRRRAEPACTKLRPGPETSRGFRHLACGKGRRRHNEPCARSALPEETRLSRVSGRPTNAGCRTLAESTCTFRNPTRANRWNARNEVCAGSSLSLPIRPARGTSSTRPRRMPFEVASSATSLAASRFAVQICRKRADKLTQDLSATQGECYGKLGLRPFFGLSRYKSS